VKPDGCRGRPAGTSTPLSGTRLLQLIQDHTHHFRDFVHYIAVPESQNAVAFGFKERRSFGIIFFLVKVLAAIHFDNQFAARGAKVSNVRSDGMLAAESDAELIVA